MSTPHLRLTGVPVLPMTTPHLRLVVHSARRRLKVDVELDAIGQLLVDQIEKTWSTVLDAIPKEPSLASTGPVSSRVAISIVALNRALLNLYQFQLEQFYRRQHHQVAVLLTQRLRAGVRREALGFNYDELVLAPPTFQDLQQVVGPAPAPLSTWLSTSLITSTIFNGIAAGEDRREIAKRLQPLFNGSASSARRLARTEGLRVATATTLQASEQLADEILGYQVQAVLDDRTRPDHRERNGTIYYRHPRPGQKSMATDMPRPPMDPPFPPGSIQWNCRCFLVPVFRD